MKRLSIFLAALLISGSAMGAPVAQRAVTLQKVERLCRNGGAELSQAAYNYVCQARDNLYASMRKDGLCYGKYSQDETKGQFEWHVCGKDSIR
jgi:hypothetical protein